MMKAKKKKIENLTMINDAYVCIQIIMDKIIIEVVLIPNNL